MLLVSSLPILLSGLNAYVAGHLSQKDFRDLVDVWVRDKVISNDVWSAIRTKLGFECENDE